MNFSEKEEKELIKILSNSFNNAQTFEEHKNKIKCQKLENNTKLLLGMVIN